MKEKWSNDSGIMLMRTKISEINDIIALENDQSNNGFILTNTYEEHKIFIKDRNIAHLTIKSSLGELLGFVLIVGLMGFSKSFELKRIVVGDKNKGVGRKALKLIKMYCFEQKKCKRLWLDVMADNDRAKHVYSSEGFNVVGDFFVNVDNERHDICAKMNLMSLNINDYYKIQKGKYQIN